MKNDSSIASVFILFSLLYEIKSLLWVFKTTQSRIANIHYTSLYLYLEICPWIKNTVVKLYVGQLYNCYEYGHNQENLISRHYCRFSSR